MNTGSTRAGTLLRVGGATAQVLQDWGAPADRAIRVGLSGGIGTGKTTIARAWGEAGAHVASADEVARQVVALGTPGLAAITARFGPGVLNEDGTLNRSRLAELAFGSEENRRDLEAITHPLIAARVAAMANRTPRTGVFVYDVPLLVEGGLAGNFDCVVMVNADMESRLQRLERRGVSPAQAKARIRTQATDEDRRAVTNLWIENCGSPGDAASLAAQVYRWFR